MLLYQLRVIERLWGSRKFASFLLTTTPYTTLLPPLLLTLLLRPLSLHTLNYLPPGPTATLFAILAQFYSAIPYQYKYRLSTSTTTTTPPNNPPTDPSITLTDKSLTYLLATQLALAQFPHSLVPAAVGWAVGYAWRSDVLPGRAAGWRVPGWVYGGKERGGEEGGDGSSENGYRRVAGGWGEGGGEGVGAGAGVGDGDAGQFEGLRRRLETGRGDGGGVGAAAGQQGRGPGQQGRTLFGQVVDRFRGGF
ncbi:hypothetical protein FQN50_006690 [Emmonsiellopsis sp. PD_5]|nr:hypothetical protein FQN50_006690 [Emmonsiellopsis sp. PD_5]